jgi:transcriptional regulator with XRE-family HTH domain
MYRCNIAGMQDGQYTRPMSAILGAYLHHLREQKKLKKTEVQRAIAKRLGKPVDYTRLWRAETGKTKTWPESDYLNALLEVIGGDPADVSWIQKHPEATIDDAVALAEKRLIIAQSKYSDLDQIIDETTEEEFNALLEEFRREFRKNPGIEDSLRTFWAGLRARGGARRQTG